MIALYTSLRIVPNLIQYEDTITSRIGCTAEKILERDSFFAETFSPRQHQDNGQYRSCLHAFTSFLYPRKQRKEQKTEPENTARFSQATAPGCTGRCVLTEDVPGVGRRNARKEHASCVPDVYQALQMPGSSNSTEPCHDLTTASPPMKKLWGI